jgi:adenosine deaminase
MSIHEVIEAILSGFSDGSSGTNLTIKTIITAMRTSSDSKMIAEAAVDFRDKGVVGFDIAGREVGYPPTNHLEAFQFLQRENFHFTIHAGEAFGLASIWEAVQYCGAERLGHGVRIIDDIDVDSSGNHHLGSLASFIRDRRIPLELCPTSNVHTGAVQSLEEHPIELLKDLGFRVTVNTDNRLMSDVSMTSELLSLNKAFGWDLDDFSWLTVNAMKSAFLPFDERINLIENIIKPGWRNLS